MMMRLTLPAVIALPLALAACAPPVPDSGAGFGDATAYNMAREGALNSGAPMVAPGAQPIVGGGVTAQPIGGTPVVPGMATPAPANGFDPNALGAAIDRAAGVPAAPAMPAMPVTPMPMPAAPGAPMATVAGSVGAAPAVPMAPAPAAVPAAPLNVPVVGQGGSGGPNLVQYALTTTNAVGMPLYQRSSLMLRSPEKVCAGYGSPDLAQLAFLEAGGPQKDRKGLDPDGDGFACAWDPTPFRNAVK